MPDSTGQGWRPDQYYTQMPLLTNQWAPPPNRQMGGMHAVDLSMFQPNGNQYPPPGYGNEQGTLLSPHATYHNDGNWNSDVDMGTPSSAGYPSESMQTYPAAHTTANNGHLHPPANSKAAPRGPNSPRSSRGHISPVQSNFAADIAPMEERPTLSRSITAPETRHGRRSTATGAEPPALKRQGTSEDGDEEFLPHDPKLRGRKRQRIPHTAVERRYRENLNAHLEKLRQTVPALAARTPAGWKPGDALHEGVKPSKCEILNGAIEHIIASGKEREALRDEVLMLRSRLAELEKWHSGSARDTPFHPSTLETWPSDGMTFKGEL